jgi:CheY-like chemotaxis protein
MKTILVVDDSKLFRVEKEHTLRKAGYLVVTAVDGLEALAVARESLPDLILLDMMLPKLDGTSVLQALKADPVTAKIPVVVLTGLSQKNEGKLIQNGATAFLEKGQSLKSEEPLLHTLKRILDSRMV